MSYLRLIILYFIPGQSWTLPPSNNTTPCSCNTARSPGIYAVITLPLLSFNSAHFLFPELGFFGLRVNTLRQTPFLCGPRRIFFSFGTNFSAMSFLVFALPRRYWLRVGRYLAPKDPCSSWLGQVLFLRAVNIRDCAVDPGCWWNNIAAKGKRLWLYTDRLCCNEFHTNEMLTLLDTYRRFLTTGWRPPVRQWFTKCDNSFHILHCCLWKGYKYS